MLNVQQDQDDDEATVDLLLRRAPSVLVSVIAHLLVLILLGLLMMTQRPDKQPLVIEIGEAESESIEVESITIEPVDVAMPSEPAPSEMTTVSFDLGPSDRVELQGNEFDGLFAAVEMQGYSEGFSRRIQDAQANGIEIVIVFDSTGSMGSEIQNVKQRILEISSSVMRKIPRAQFSLVTYRDRGDAYVARGIELQKNPSHLLSFINGVQAGGGGDRPEAVQAGMRVAIEDNRFRSKAQKVMILFGDAPPHAYDLPICLKYAERFRGYRKGQVHTVTCRASTPLREFYEIARSGGGDAFLMNQADRLMDEILVLAFGPKNRDEVLRFFEVESEPANQKSRRRR